jgi:hypothetical protein
VEEAARLIWKAGPSPPWRNQPSEPRARSSKQHVGVGCPSERLGRIQQLHPTECLSECSSSVSVELRQPQSCVLAVLRTNDSYPSTVQPSDQKAALRRPCPDWNNPLAELVPKPRTHECADSDFALEHLQLRKTPAGMLVTLAKATERFARHHMPHQTLRAIVQSSLT